MPELPEVETIRKGLEKTVKGKHIRSVEIRWPGIVHGSSVNEFKKYAEGKRVVGTGRRGKYLLIHLSRGRSLILHLKMSGVLSFIKNGVRHRPDKHTHIIFHFTDGSSLQFSETRKFGFVENIASQGVDGYFNKKKMGPEPLDTVGTGRDLSVHEFIVRLKAHPKTTVKSALLNQQIIAGVGNIYADEALFSAGIRPTRRVMSLNEGELRHLYSGMKNVLQTGFAGQGRPCVFIKQSSVK